MGKISFEYSERKILGKSWKMGRWRGGWWRSELVSILSLEKFAESRGRQAPPGAGSYVSKILEMGDDTECGGTFVAGCVEEVEGKKTWNRIVGSRRE